jgi:hypothetical protein
MQSLIQRAFELAPECSTMKELRQRLEREGYSSVSTHLGGLATQRQLRPLFNNGEGQLPRGPRREPMNPILKIGEG